MTLINNSTLDNSSIQPNDTHSGSKSHALFSDHTSDPWGQTRLTVSHDKRPRLTNVLRSIDGCSERYMATLTTGYSVTLELHRKALSDTLHRVNKKLFGNPYSRHGRVCLGTYAVQETTIDLGIHSHVLIGVPDEGRSVKAIKFEGRLADLLIGTWTSMCPGARPSGQDVREITYFHGAANYIHKDVFNLSTFDNVDVMNTSVAKI